MSEIGCTTPFGPNKSKICTNSDDAAKAIALFRDLTRGNSNEADRRCPATCKYQLMTFEQREQALFWYGLGQLQDKGRVAIAFQRRFVKLSKSRYSYQLLELIAELGGYVGLFLGLSINQLSKLFEQFLGIKMVWFSQ